MKTEKFTKTDESFNDNINNSTKWFTDSTNLFLEAQNKQIKFVTDLFNQTINHSFANFGKDTFTALSNNSEKLGDMMKQNMETISKMAEANMKTITELTTQANATLFSKEAFAQLTESFTKNAEQVTAFNQNAYNALIKQSEISNAFVKPFAENLKNEFEANVQKVNDTLKQNMSSITNFTNPSFDINKNIFIDLSNQMKNVFSNNVKSWSDLMTKYSAGDTFKFDPFKAAQKAEPKETQASKNKMNPMHV